MRNIFLFIRRHFVFLSFVVFQAIALWMLFKYNSFHRAVFLGAANEVTGSINTQVDKVDDYFHLREENKRVHHMNDSLMNLLKTNYNIPDTSSTVRLDSTRVDSLVQYRRYIYRDAKVVYNSVNAENNYLQLNRGSNQGIKDNMAVISSDGAIIGIIINTSPNFSQVLSLLHTKSRVPAALKKTGTTGTIKWDADDPRFVTLEGISKDVDVNFMVGRIASVSVDKATGFYSIKVQTAVNFSTVQQVFVTENLQRDEQVKLEKETERKMDQDKKPSN
jgi:rod shape-determining protein MreC